MELMEKQGFKQAEVGLIPEDWQVKLLDEIADVIDPHPSHRAPAETKSGIPFLGIGDFDERGFIKSKNQRLVSKHILGEHNSRYDLRENLIGLGRVASIGKVVTLRNDIGEYAISPTLGVIRSKGVDHNYLRFILSSSYIKNYFKKIMSGSTRSSVGMIVLRKIPIPLPSPTEQKAIATALSEIDELINSLEKLISKKKAIKQGALQELLTPPNKGGKRLSGFEGEWETRRIGDIFKIMAGGDLDKDNFSRVKSEEYKYNIYANSLVNKGTYGYTRNPKFNENSVTVTARGSLGHAEFRREPFDAIVRLLVLEPIFKLHGFFFSEYINNKIEFAYESTGVPQLTAPQISKYEVSFPQDLEEQNAIAQILSDMDAEISKLEAKKGKYQSIKQGMMQELLTGKTRLV